MKKAINTEMVTGVPVEVTTEELRRNLEGGKIIEAIRLKVNRNGGRVDKVKFDERILPEVRIHPLSN